MGIRMLHTRGIIAKFYPIGATGPTRRAAVAGENNKTEDV